MDQRSGRRLRRLTVAAAAGSVLLTGGGLSSAYAHGSDPAGRTLTAKLTGASERPGPGDPDGRGKARVRLRGDRVCFTVSWRRIDAPTMAHIHRGGREEAGPVVVLLLEVPGGLGAPVSRVGGCADADRDLVKAIRQDPRAYYVNVHNAAFPAGAIRGQLHR